jgi:hypothetical protein
MTLLTICQGLASNVGLAMPDVIATSPQREWKEALRMANEAGEEMARRVDWAVLRITATVTGSGTNVALSLPANFSRLSQGITARMGRQIIRPLTRAEWDGLTPTMGTPRYFILTNGVVQFWPYPASGQEITVSYTERNWVQGATPAIVPPGFTLSMVQKSAFTADDDIARFSEDVLTKGLIVRWRRQKGMSYADEEAEYEAALADVAAFDDRTRL